jgi:hypothetical protein
MLDKPTPPQGMMNGDDTVPGGNTVSLLNRGNGSAGTPAAGDASGRVTRSSRGLRGWGGVALGALVVVALGATGATLLTSKNDPPPATPTPAPPSATQSSGPSTPSASPTPTLSAEQVAVSGATAGYKAWRSVQDRVAMSGGTVATEALLASVATGKELNIDRFTALTYYKARGRKMVKPGVIVSVKPTSVGTAGADGTITNITLTVCRDVSGAVILQNGKSTKTPSSPTHLTDTAKMTLVQGRWKALEVTNKPSKGGCS